MYIAAVGALIGVCQVAVGHPIDTAKVLSQNRKNVVLPKFSQYYRGCMYPLLCSATVNSILFPTYSYVNTHSGNNYIAGSISGLAISPILFGFDYFKILRQNNINTVSIKSTKGLPLLSVRESLAMGLYFGNYEILKNYVDDGIAGGISGVVSWSLTYPIDVIISRQISQQVSIKQALSQRNLVAGIEFCLLRALIVNSLSFKLYSVLVE